MDATNPPAAISEDDLFTQVAAIARRIATRVVPRDSVDDVVQDVALRCLTEHRAGRWIFDRSRLPGLVKMLVFVYTTHHAQQTRRRGERDAVHERDVRASDHVWMSPDLAIEQQELEVVYDRVLHSLSPACRRAYTLVREQELTYDQAAARLGVSRAAICFHIVTAQNRFREALREHGVSIPAPRGTAKQPRARRRAPRHKRRSAPTIRPCSPAARSNGVGDGSGSVTTRTGSSAS